MIASFFKQLLNSCGMVFRMFRAFFTRQIMGIRARIRRVTSLSRQAFKLLPKAMSSVAVAGKKPTKREDFVETKRLFVAKSLLVMLVVGLVALGLLIYFVVWPWLVRMFFTAKLYQGDSAVTAYNGKVIVYYDEGKQEPMLQGKMEEGLVQGQGKAYDEAGRILYEGNFVNGLYEGQGNQYEEGILVYSGEFAGGVYEGQGSKYEDGALVYTGEFSGGVYEGKGTLYENGEVVYEGEFSNGLKDGTGTEYDANGQILYKGEFAEDLYDGTGTAYYSNGATQYRGGYLQGKYDGDGTLYYEDGQIQYKGSFLDGLYDQTGTLYNPDGSVLYQGNFLQGQYSGDGVLNITKELKLTGTFEAGTPVGTATMHRNGKLYYEGMVENLLPHGEGTLYASTGESIYVGNMINGVPDLGALLNKTGDEVRAAFGEAELIENQGERNGFSITNKALGVTLFCTYKTEEADPTVYYVYGYNQGADEFAGAIAWQNAEEYEAQAEGYEKQERDENAVFTGGVPYANGKYHRTAYYYEAYVFVGWSQVGEQEWFMVEWVAGQSLPSGGSGTDSGSAGNAERMEGLLEKLGLKEGTGGTEGNTTSGQSQNQNQSGSGSGISSGQSGVSSGQSGISSGQSNAENSSENTASDGQETLQTVASCAYYGTQPAIGLLSGGTASGETFEKALTAMVDYYLQAEIRQAMEEQAALKADLLATEQIKLSMGTGSQETVDALVAEVSKLELSANRAMVAMERIQLEAKGVLTGNLADYDMTDALFLEDPITMDVDALMAAGDSEAIRLALMDLELAWQELQQAQADYETASVALATALQNYAMGNADAKARCDALCSESQAAVTLHEAIHACATQMIALNTLTNGALANQYGWLDALSQ